MSRQISQVLPPSTFGDRRSNTVESEVHRKQHDASSWVIAAWVRPRLRMRGCSPTAATPMLNSLRQTCDTRDSMHEPSPTLRFEERSRRGCATRKACKHCNNACDKRRNLGTRTSHPVIHLSVYRNYCITRVRVAHEQCAKTIVGHLSICQTGRFGCFSPLSRPIDTHWWCGCVGKNNKGDDQFQCPTQSIIAPACACCVFMVSCLVCCMAEEATLQQGIHEAPAASQG